MKKFLNYLALAVIAGAAVSMTACSNDDETIQVPVGSTADNSISFSSYISRASSTTSDNLANFGVFAYYNLGTAYDVTGQSQNPDFMYNQQVSKNGAAWEYDPIKYWPNDATQKISFLGYAPYTATADVTAAGGDTSHVTAFSANDANGDATLGFYVGTDISKQVDLVYAKAMDKTNADGTVNLDFKHALSRLAFKVVGWEPGTGETFDNNTTVTINAVKFATVRQAATLNLRTGLWSDPVDDSDLHAYTVGTVNDNIQNNIITAGDTDTKLLNKADDFLMIMPDLAYTESAAPDQYVVFVDYTVVTIDPAVDGGQTKIRQNIYRRLSPGFEAGKSYFITIHLGMNGYSGNDDGDDDGPVPTDPDPDPTEPIDPTPASDNNYVKFSASVTSWDETEPAIDISLVTRP